MRYQKTRKIVRVISRITAKSAHWLSGLGVMLLVNSCLLTPVWAAADDPLASMKDMIKSMFGTHSTVMFCVYIAELFIGVLIYLKTRNFTAFLGAPIVMLFTAGMYKLIAG